MKYLLTYTLKVNLLLLVKCVSSFVLFIPAVSYSQENVLVITSGEEKVYQIFFDRLKTQIKNNITIAQINISEVNTYKQVNNKILISIGHKAAEVISKQTSNSNVIYALIPDNTAPDNESTCTHKSCYKVYINQPVSRYIKLFRTIFPDDYTLAFATTQAETIRSQLLKIAAEKYHFNYKQIVIRQNDAIARTLINNLENKDILLALSDPEIYNANNAKSILLSTYHKNVPIIAYSKSFAKAGALISLYSSIEDIADETARLTNKIITNKQPHEREFYPDNFSVEINSAVASSLNIDIDTEDNIKRKIK